MTTGATNAEWAHFDLVLGLGSDLLPVVSNLEARIAPNSKLKALGKTPSQYNDARHVVGMADWPNHVASDLNLTRWQREPDYGLCIITRRVRALDIDIHDSAQAQSVVDTIEQHLGLRLPCRWRENSGKVLLALIIDGDMPKRKIVVEGGLIEFLATGQQFIAAGQHTSGVRYRWRTGNAEGLPDDIPAVTPEQFEALWALLVERYAIETPRTRGHGARKHAAHIDLPDPVADFLDAQGHVLGVQRDGALLIKCPWSDEHSQGEDGDGSTVWFPAGTNGYDRGHFRCLHGHCEDRSDGDLFAAVGYQPNHEADFALIEAEDIEQDGAPQRPVDALAALGLRRKVGKGQWAGWFVATAENIVAALRLAHVCGFEVRFDVFRDEIMRRTPGGEWQPFKDADYTRLKLALESAHVEPIPFELLRACVRLIADEQTFDSAQDVLARLRWDGVPRIEAFYSRYLKADDTPYTRACGLYTWTAMAGRVLVPGCKADMVPILVGAQGLRKSSAVEVMALNPEWHGSLALSGKDADLSRQMRGKAVIELPELRGLRTRELESIKAFITEGSNAWIAKYQEFETKYPRRCLFIGTTNEQEFLDDDTGNRRWLPISVGFADLDLLRAEREQLWAEGVVRFQAGGVQYEQAEALATAEHAAHTVSDEWEEPIRNFLHTPDQLSGEKPIDRGFVTNQQIFAHALFITVERTDTRTAKRLARAMRKLGWVASRTMHARGWRLVTHDDTCEFC
ncbi:replication protein [Bordetella hinzii]|uniref:VapE domain-containing protein n=1 Tax=Bordetella hinzii TaxID=103855 RepID=UPI0013EFE966|nr:VapE domain-containing protein [Bordetella hinzii]QII84187.1 replication protein [Bordetella hinzii]